MNRNAGKAVVGGCIGCLLGGIVGALLGGGVGAYSDHQAAARPQQGLLDFQLVGPMNALWGASCGAAVGALIGSIGGAAYAVSRSEKQRAESALGQPQPQTVASVDPGASADEELARLKKRVQELEDEQR